MRIYGHNTGQQSQNRENKHGNLERFKHGRQCGELIRGQFIRLEPASPGTAWVNLEGEPLLAQLPANLALLAKNIFSGMGVGATPTGVNIKDFPLQPGYSCLFILEQVEPEPILRMLFPHNMEQESEVDSTILKEQVRLSFKAYLELPITLLISRYTRQRLKMDALLLNKFQSTAPTQKINSSRQQNNPGSTLQRKIKIYQELVFNEQEITRQYIELSYYRTAILHQLAPHGLINLCYAPWLNPELRALDLVFYCKPLETKMKTDVPCVTLFFMDKNSVQQSLHGTYNMGWNISALQITEQCRDLQDFLLSFKPDSLRQGFFSAKA